MDEQKGDEITLPNLPRRPRTDPPRMTLDLSPGNIAKLVDLAKSGSNDDAFHITTDENGQIVALEADTPYTIEPGVYDLDKYRKKIDEELIEM